jgi:hypothetical protein
MNQQANAPGYAQVHVINNQAPSNGLGIAGFITSLVSLFVCGGCLSPVALILSAIALFGKPKGFAIAGTIISVIGMIPLLLIIVVPVMMIGLLSSAFASVGFSGFVVDMQGFAITSQIDAYIDQNGSVPASLASVQTLDQSITQDPWGNAFVYEPDPTNNTYVLFSLGPDGIRDTADDIQIHP